MHRDNSSPFRSPLGVILALFMLGIAGLMWWWPASGSVLSPETYDVMTALYRVCNQQSEQGLTKIEQTLEHLQADTRPEDPSIDRVRVIIEKARSGEWKEAMRDAHQSLADQARR